MDRIGSPDSSLGALFECGTTGAFPGSARVVSSAALCSPPPPPSPGEAVWKQGRTGAVRATVTFRFDGFGCVE